MENLEQQLEEATSFAKYQATLNNERRQLREQFEADTVLAYNGGLFKITQEWLGGFDTNQKWFLDMNGNPCGIDDGLDFFNLAKQTYHEALSKYGEEYQQLRRKRSVRSLVDL